MPSGSKTADAKSVWALITKAVQEARAAGYTAHTLGMADEFPILLFHPKHADPSKKCVLVVGGVHGDEPSGVNACLEVMKNPPVGVNVSFIPMANPVGREKGTRNGVGTDPNRGYFGGFPSIEGGALRNHVKLLHTLGHDGLLSIHEDSEWEGFYIYDGEYQGNGPGALGLTLRSIGQKFLPVAPNDVDASGNVLHDGFILNTEDDSFEDWMHFKGKITPTILVEMPTKHDWDKRVQAASAIIRGFADFIAGEDASKVAVRHMIKMAKEGTVPDPFGYLMTLDLYDCEEGTADDLSLCYDFLEDLVKYLKMTPQSPPFLFHSDAEKYPDKAGLSGWIPLIESGIQIHTLSPKNFVSIDVYSCSKFSPEGVEEFVQKWFAPKQVEKSFIERGTRYNMKEASAKDGKKVGDRTEVGLFIPLPPELADQFPSLGDDDKSPPHCTFLYVGNVSKEKEPLFLDTLHRTFAQLNRAVRGNLYGPDFFLHPAKNRRVAVMRVRFNQHLDEIRWKLRDALTSAGFQVDDSFPLVYQPHCTLAYMDGLAGPYEGPVPKGDWTFSEIEVWGLPKLHVIPFQQDKLTRMASKYMDAMKHRTSVALMKFLSGVATGLGVGKHVYVVGGAVRNFIINEPIKDIDVVVDSIGAGKDSAWFAKELQKAIPVQTSLVTNQYGVAILTIKGDWYLGDDNLKGEDIEIANARKESYGESAGKGYKPHMVEPATIEEDVVRREFTFNTLMWRLYDLANGPDKAEILDLTGCGKKDLAEGMMRCPSSPDKTFTDDPSRMIRAIKFLIKYGFKIAPDVEASIRRNAEKLRNIPPGHLSNMLIGLFFEPGYGARAMNEMVKLGLLDVIRDIAKTDKSFREALANWADRSAKVEFLFELMDYNMPTGRRLKFLNPGQLTRLRDITAPMSSEEADAIIQVLDQPGKVVDMAGLITEFGLKGPEIRQLTESARQVLLDDPILAEIPPKWEQKIRERMGKTASTDLEASKFQESDLEPARQDFERAYQAAAQIIKTYDKEHPNDPPDRRKFGLEVWFSHARMRDPSWAEWAKLFVAGDKLIRVLLDQKAVPPNKAKGLEMASRAFLSIRRYPKDVAGWVERNTKHILFLLDAAKTWPQKQEGGLDLFKVGPFSVHNTIGADEKKVEVVKGLFERAISAINKLGGPFADFKKVLHGDVYLVARLKQGNVAAWYNSADDTVYVRPDKVMGGGDLHSLIHELAHRHWRKFMSNLQQAIWNQYHMDMAGESVKPVLPAVGDTIPMVVNKSKNPRVVSIDFNGSLYTLAVPTPSDPNAVVQVPKAKIYDWVRALLHDQKFPTPYAAQGGHEEHFCEALAFYILGKLKPEQIPPLEAAMAGKMEKPKGKTFHQQLQEDLGKTRNAADRLAVRYMMKKGYYFNVGDPILFGKYKNKQGLIKGFGTNPKSGTPTVIIEPVPKGRKQDKEFGLYTIWHADPTRRPITAAERLAARYIEAKSFKEWLAWIAQPFDVIWKHHKEFVYGPVDDAIDAIIKELAPVLVKRIGEKEVDEWVEEFINGAVQGQTDKREDKTLVSADEDPYHAGYEWGQLHAEEFSGRTLPPAVHKMVVQTAIDSFRHHITEEVVTELLKKAWHAINPVNTVKAIIKAVRKYGWKVGVGAALFELSEHFVLPSVMITLTGDKDYAVLGTLPIGEVIYAVVLRILGRTPGELNKADPDGHLDWYERTFGPVKIASLLRQSSDGDDFRAGDQVVIGPLMGNIEYMAGYALDDKDSCEGNIRAITRDGEAEDIDCDSVHPYDRFRERTPDQWIAYDWQNMVDRIAAKYKDKKTVKDKDGDDMVVYEYSDKQIANRNREKAERVEKLRGKLHKLQAAIKKDLGSDDLKTRMTALAIGLINDTYERVGNEASAKDGHYGVTGWLVKHVTFSDGKAKFKYVGKSGVDHDKETTDKDLIKALKEAVKGKDKSDPVFEMDDFTVTSETVNEYLKPFDITAKDIRGLHANREVQQALKSIRSKGGKLPEDKKEREKKLKDEFKEALEIAAEAVGHEPSTLKSQYLVPGVEENYLKDGTVKENLARQKSASLDHPSVNCPVCGQRYVMSCRCRISEKHCANDHQWVWCPDHNVPVVVTGNTHGVGMPWDGCRCAFGTPMPRTATKTHAEREDEEADRLVKPAPKKKPPRYDLRDERVQDDPDDDTKGQRADEDDDLSLNYKKVSATDRLAERWLESKKKNKRPKPPTPPKPPSPPGGGKDPAKEGHKPGDIWQSEETGKWSVKMEDDKTQGGFESEEEAKAALERYRSGDKTPKEEKPEDKDAPEEKKPEGPATPEDDLKSDTAVQRDENGNMTGVDKKSPVFQELSKKHSKDLIELALFMREIASGSKVELPQSVVKSKAYKELDMPISPKNKALVQKLLEADSPYAEVVADWDKASKKHKPAEPEKKKEPTKEEPEPSPKEEKAPEKEPEPPAKEEAPAEDKPAEPTKEKSPPAEDPKPEDKPADAKPEEKPKAEEDKSTTSYQSLMVDMKKDPKYKNALGDLAKLDPEEQKAVAQAYQEQLDEAMAEIQSGEGLSPRMIQDASDALANPTGGSIASPDMMGRSLAMMVVAQRLIANPLSMSGKIDGLSEVPLDANGMLKQAMTSATYYKSLTPELRQEAIRQAETAYRKAAEGSPQRKELDRLMDGLHHAAIVSGDFDDPKGKQRVIPPRTAPGPAIRSVLKVMANSNEDSKFLEMVITNPQGLADPKTKQGMSQILRDMADEDLYEACGGSSGPDKLTISVMESGDLDPKVKKQAREMLIAGMSDSIAATHEISFRLTENVRRTKDEYAEKAKQEQQKAPAKKDKGEAPDLSYEEHELLGGHERGICTGCIPPDGKETIQETVNRKENSIRERQDKARVDMLKCQSTAKTKKQRNQCHKRFQDMIRKPKGGGKGKKAFDDDELDGMTDADIWAETINVARLSQAQAYLEMLEQTFGELPIDEPVKVQIETAIKLHDSSELDKKYVREGEKFEKTAQRGKLSQSFFYTRDHLCRGPECAPMTLSMEDPTLKEEDTMTTKLTKKGALSVSTALDRVATLFQEEFETLGLDPKIANDFAMRCDLLADHVEKRAGLNPRAKKALTELDVVKEQGFDPEGIGQEKSGPLEMVDSQEPWMNGEFSQQEKRELRYLQQGGKLGPNPVDGPRPPMAGKQSFVVVGQQTIVNKLSTVETHLKQAALRLATAKQPKLATNLTKLAQSIMDMQLGIVNGTVTAAQSMQFVDAMDRILPHIAAVNPQTLPKVAKMVDLALKVAKKAEDEEEPDGDEKKKAKKSEDEKDDDKKKDDEKDDKKDDGKENFFEKMEKAKADKDKKGKKAKKSDDDEDEGEPEDEPEEEAEGEPEEDKKGKKASHGFVLDAE